MKKKNLIRVEILAVSAQFILKKPGILDERNREITGNFKMENRWSPWDWYTFFLIVLVELEEREKRVPQTEGNVLGGGVKTVAVSVCVCV